MHGEPVGQHLCRLRLRDRLRNLFEAADALLVVRRIGSGETTGCSLLALVVEVPLAVLDMGSAIVARRPRS